MFHYIISYYIIPYMIYDIMLDYSDLISMIALTLGAVWYYDDFEIRDWIRIMEPMKIGTDVVLRVFPNPERFKTCYVEDWDERIKKVDRDSPCGSGLGMLVGVLGIARVEAYGLCKELDEVWE